MQCCEFGSDSWFVEKFHKIFFVLKTLFSKGFTGLFTGYLYFGHF